MPTVKEYIDSIRNRNSNTAKTAVKVGATVVGASVGGTIGGTVAGLPTVGIAAPIGIAVGAVVGGAVGYGVGYVADTLIIEKFDNRRTKKVNALDKINEDITAFENAIRNTYA